MPDPDAFPDDLDLVLGGRLIAELHEEAERLAGPAPEAGALFDLPDQPRGGAHL